MAVRLIDWRTIRAEKIQRSRAWIMVRVSTGEFPAPAVRGAGKGGNLWVESEVDRWLASYIERSRGQP